MWATIAKLVGGPLISEGFKWLMGKQEVKKQERALKAEWELAAMRRSSTFLRVVSFATVLGPIYHAYFLVMWNTPMEKPEDVANAIQTVFSAFPDWFTGLAVVILLAIWGKRELDTSAVEKSVADTNKARTEAARALQERKTEEFKNPKM